MSYLTQLQRNLAPEARASNERRVIEGIYAKYMQGRGLDIGYRGENGTEAIVPVVEGALGIDLNYPGYDGLHLPFSDNSQDFVFASHILEHVPAPVSYIREWMRVLKPGKALIIAVPHQDLYERRAHPPSQWNLGHMVFFRVGDLAKEIEAALSPRTFVIDSLRTIEYNYDYTVPFDKHAQGRYEIEAIVRKL